MRILFVARYLQSVNQKKLVCLSRQPGVQLWHLLPERWRDAFNEYRATSGDRGGYQQIAYPVRNVPDIHRFFYWPPPWFIRALKPDLIHLEEEPDSLAALEFGLLRMWLAPHAKLLLFTWQNILRPTNRLVAIITRFNLRQTSGVICGNREAVGVVHAHGFRGPMAVIPQLGVDPADFAPRHREAQRTRYNLRAFAAGYIGRLTPEKGLETLLEAVAPLTGVQLLLVGQGPLLAELKNLQGQTIWKERLILAGSLSHLETAQTLAALDVLILPSLTRPNWKEQFGHVLIEAMAAGVPVVGSNSGAIPEVVGDAGLIFPEGDVEALRTNLLQLQTDPALRADLSARGLARVEAYYTHERIAERTFTFYQQLMSLRP